MTKRKKSTFTNFRDLGNAENTCIKEGKIFRSSNPADLTEEDKSLIESLGLDSIVDLRSKGEIREKPDFVPKGTKYIHAPVFSDKDFPFIVVTKIAKLKATLIKDKKNGLIKKDKFESYLAMIDRHAYEEIFKCMDRGETFLFHCTEGKDRTGIAAALIELSLGRTREEALHEYLESDKFRPNKNRDYLYKIGVPKEFVQEINYCEQVHEELFNLALDYAEEKYGSIDNYLESHFGITNERRAKWKETYTKHSVIFSR